MAVFVAKSRTANSRFRVVRKYNPDEPRDDHGRWTDGELPDPDKPMTAEEYAASRAEDKDQRNVADYDPIPIYRGSDPEIIESIRRYKSAMGDDDAYTINRELRSGAPLTPGTAKAVANLDRAFADGAGEIRDYHTRQPKDAWLYKGVDGRFPIGQLKEGDIVTDNGFVSTTTNKVFATEWARQKQGTHGKGAVFKITAPAGTKALQLQDSSSQDEGEVLLNRGSRFRVTRMAPHRFIEAELLP